MADKIPKHCKGCVHHSSNGSKGTPMFSWCTKISKRSHRAVGSCKILGAKTEAH